MLNYYTLLYYIFLLAIEQNSELGKRQPNRNPLHKSALHISVARWLQKKNKEVNNIAFEANEADRSVRCIPCKKSITIYAYKKKGWNIGNFTRHLQEQHSKESATDNGNTLFLDNEN